MFAVDTNLLLYALNPDSRDHPAARKLLDGWRSHREPWCLTSGIVYESLRVSTHPAVFPRPLRLDQAWSWLEVLLGAPGCTLLVETERLQAVGREVVEAHPRLAENVIHDLHSAILLKEHGIEEIRTADTNFHQFKFLRVVSGS
jgi:toxin-antitoxin system PIN domain toxin